MDRTSWLTLATAFAVIAIGAQFEIGKNVIQMLLWN